MKDKEIEFLDLSIDDIKIKSDKTKILDVFETLIQNAHEYAGSFGRIEIGIDDGEKEVTFFVKDNGDGMSEEKQEQLFKDDDSSSSLVTSKELVESMGGKIWMESVPYLGTKLYFTIPKFK